MEPEAGLFIDIKRPAPEIDCGVEPQGRRNKGTTEQRDDQRSAKDNIGTGTVIRCEGHELLTTQRRNQIACFVE